MSKGFVLIIYGFFFFVKVCLTNLITKLLGVLYTNVVIKMYS